MKQRITILTMALLAVMLLCDKAFAASSGKCGDSITWTLDDDGNLTLTGSGPTFWPTALSPFANNTEIKSVIIGDGITDLRWGIFEGCANLTSVSIPNSVTALSEGSFSGCVSLGSITIPERVTSITDRTFEGCTNLASVTLPKKLTKIGERAFCGCSSLKNITIPDSVTTIGNCAFSECSSLTSVSIPENVTNITGAFSGCTGLTSVSIPENVTNITGAFSGCTGLTSVTLPKKLTEIGERAFCECSSLKGISIPDSVKAIGDGAFMSCHDLDSITLPTGLITIGDYAFNDTGLDTITIPENVTSIGASAFTGHGFMEIAVNAAVPPKIARNSFQFHVTGYIRTPLASIPAYRQSEIWKDMKNYGISFYGGKVIKDGITYYIDDHGAFAHSADSSLTEIVFEENVEFEGSKHPLYCIEYCLFGHAYFDTSNGCDATLITLPSTVKEINGGAFEKVNYPIIIVRATTPPALEGRIPMTTAIVPRESAKAYRDSDIWKDMTIIGDGKNHIEVTTSKTVDLTEAIMTQARLTPASVNSIKVHGPLTENDIVNTLNTNMRSCYSIDLSDAEIDALPKSAFSGKSELIDIALPTSLKSIGDNAFKDCTALLSTIKLPEGVEKIGNYAFSNCVNAKFSPELPTTLNSIGSCAFDKCRISEIILPEGLSTMGLGAFSECKLLKKVDMTNLFNLTVIPSSAFNGCASLSEVILPFNLESIDEWAFAGCSALSKLDFVASLKTIRGGAFSGCTSLKSLDLFKCEGLKEISAEAFASCTSLKSLNLPLALQTIGNGAFNGCSAINLISSPVPTPPAIYSESTLNGIDKDVCVLAMPKDSYMAYFRAPYWGQFIEYTASVIVGVEGQGSVTYGNNGGQQPETAMPLRAPETSPDASMATAYNGINICAKGNTTLTFKIVPNEGEEIMSVTYAGKDVTSQVVDGLFTTPEISRDTDLKVSFTSNQGGVSQIDADGIRAYAKGRTIHIIASKKARVRIATVTGVQRCIDAEAGETTMEMAAPGIYIVNGQKVIVR